MPNTVTVRADQEWLDTGLPRPKVGNFVRVQAAGTWNFRPGDQWTTGPQGGSVASDYMRVDGDTTMPHHGEGAVRGALIGKWGKDGETFKVGEHYTERGLTDDPFKGRTLFLGINDDGFADNSGTLSVRFGEETSARDVTAPTYHYDPANGWIQNKD